jgi:hypothetical protein
VTPRRGPRFAGRFSGGPALACLVLLGACGRLGFGSQAPSDAAQDGMPDAQQRLETLTIPATGAQVTSTTTLALGVTYQLRAIGTFIISPSADAEYMFTEPDQDDPDNLCDDGFTDMGLSIDDPTVDGEKSPSWGPYRSDHIYQVDFVGKGKPIEARIHDTFYANNTGLITLEIFGPTG